MHLGRCRSCPVPVLNPGAGAGGRLEPVVTEEDRVIATSADTEASRADEHIAFDPIVTLGVPQVGVPWKVLQ